MTLLKYSLSGILLCLALSCFSQINKKEIRPLSIGDTIPADLELTHVYNYPVSKIRISDLKGKLVIFDFWATWCGACVQSFPHMQSLKQKLGNDLSIFLVNSTSTRDNKAKIDLFFNRRKAQTGADLKLPLIIQDSVLEKMFRHSTLPHYVWVNNEGIVKAITESSEVTEDNIRLVLQNRRTSIRMKVSANSLDANKPLFTKGNLGEGQADIFLGRSILTGMKEGESAWVGQRRNEQNEITGFFMFNKPLYTLISTAYSDYNFKKNRTIVDVRNEIPLDYNDMDQAVNNYLYCYDLSIPPTSYEALKQYLQEDIYRYLNIKVYTEERPVKCIILRSTDKLESSSSEYKKKESDLEEQSLRKYLYAFPIHEATDILNLYSDMPIIDETNLKNKIDILLPYSLSDPQAIVEALKKAGFSTQIEFRTLELTIISDK